MCGRRRTLSTHIISSTLWPVGVKANVVPSSRSNFHPARSSLHMESSVDTVSVEWSALPMSMLNELPLRSSPHRTQRLAHAATLVQFATSDSPWYVPFGRTSGSPCYVVIMTFQRKITISGCPSCLSGEAGKFDFVISVEDVDVW